LCAAALFFTACSEDDDDSIDSNDTIKKGDLEFPARKGGSSIVITHVGTLNDKSGLTGVNYSVEWDIEKHAQRWSCYKMYNAVNRSNVTRYKASNDGSMSSTCQYPNDLDIPGQYKLTIDPYKYSGYDHGHICPSADRLSSKEANYQTFFMTNMQPQYGDKDNTGRYDFNGGIWGDLETQVRQWAARFDTLYVCKGGTIDRDDQIIEYVCQSSHQNTRVNANHVPVPKYFFMALVSQTTKGIRGIAFWMEHLDEDRSGDKLSQYAISIDELENKTGLDFFCNLPDDTENSVEADLTLSDWNLQ
jgi:endonuclease G